MESVAHDGEPRPAGSMPSSSILDLFRLDSRVAVVTGASAGLGVAFATALAEAGARVVVAARRKEELSKTQRIIEQLGHEAEPIVADVSSPEDCQRIADAAIARWGRLDILVNNAGVATAAPASRESPDEFRRVIDINLNGSYWMAQAAGRAMSGGGTIVNLSSILGLTTAGLPQAAYSASKAALFGLTRDLAAQWTPRKQIRVNCLVPGFFMTPMTEQHQPGYLDAQVARILVGRLGKLEELAATLVWLVSDAAAYVTGQMIVVDGGFTIT